MDFTKVYRPQPITLAEFRVQQPTTMPDEEVCHAYTRYRENFLTDLAERIKNGEKFFSAAEIAERLIALEDDNEEKPESASMAGFHVKSITDIPREQIQAFIMDLNITRLFKES